MGVEPICSVENCGKPTRSLGLCQIHYARQRRHGTFGLKRNANGTSKAFLDAALTATTDDCILWPYTKRSGYGSLAHEGNTISAHRYVCEKTHGAAVPPATYACHACGNRACVNPRHIRWGTNVENYFDMVKHGNRKTTHLNEPDIIAIRKSTETPNELAVRYGVTVSAIHQILSRRNWKHVA